MELDGIDRGVISDEWVGPLGTTFNLPDGADEIILVHWSNDVYGEGDHSNANSVVPSSVCIGYETGAPNIDYGDAPSTYGNIDVSITGDYES